MSEEILQSHWLKFAAAAVGSLLIYSLKSVETQIIIIINIIIIWTGTSVLKLQIKTDTESKVKQEDLQLILQAILTKTKYWRLKVH